MSYCNRCGALIDGIAEGVVQVGHEWFGTLYHVSCFSLLHSEQIEAERQAFRAQLQEERLTRNTVETQRWCKQGNSK